MPTSRTELKTTPKADNADAGDTAAAPANASPTVESAVPDPIALVVPIKFVATHESLYAAVRRCAAVVPKFNSRNITPYHRLLVSVVPLEMAEPGAISLRGCGTGEWSEWDISVRVTGDARGTDATPWQFAVDAFALGAVLAQMDRSKLISINGTITGNAGKITVSDGSFQAVLQIVGEAEWVDLLAAKTSSPSRQTPGCSFVVEGHKLAEQMRFALLAAATDATRPTICSIVLECDAATAKPWVRFVATDTQRLHITEPLSVDFDTNSPPQWTAIIPSEAAAHVLPLLRRGTNPTVWLDGELLYFTIGDYTFRTIVSDRAYVQYERVVPGNLPFALRIDRQALSRAVRRAAAMLNGSTGVGFGVKGETLTLYTVSGSYGLSRERIAVELLGKVPAGYENKSFDFTWSFAPAYICDGLAALGNCTTVALSCEAPLRPFRLTVADEEEGQNESGTARRGTVVIMPRVSEEATK